MFYCVTNRWFTYSDFELQCKLLKKLSSNSQTKNRHRKSKVFCMYGTVALRSPVQTFYDRRATCSSVMEKFWLPDNCYKIKFYYASHGKLGPPWTNIFHASQTEEYPQRDVIISNAELAYQKSACIFSVRTIDQQHYSRNK